MSGFAVTPCLVKGTSSGAAAPSQANGRGTHVPLSLGTRYGLAGLGSQSDGTTIGQLSVVLTSGCVVLALIPANRALARRIEAASAKQQAWRGARLAAVGDLLRGCVSVKAGCWEPAFQARIAGARAGEVRQLAIRKALDALCVWSWAVTSLLTMLATFGMAAASGVRLGSAAAFTSLALFGVLVAPLNSLPWVIGGLVDAGVSARRLVAYLRAAGDGLVGGSGQGRAAAWPGPSPHPSPRRLAGTDAPPPPGGLMFGGCPLGMATTAEGSGAPPDGLAVAVSHATFSWTKDGGGPASCLPHLRRLPPQPQPALVDICLALRAGCLAVVIGDAGSGKSSLLAAIAGEMGLRSGSVRVAGRLAYVPQGAWCASGASVRANILLGGGGAPVDEARYAATVSAVALDVDFGAWPRGDATPGGSLSGGQAARRPGPRALRAAGRLPAMPVFFLKHVFERGSRGGAPNAIQSKYGRA